MYLFRDGRITDIVAKAAAHQSFEDWPWLLLFRELDDAYPKSRFVLTVRETHSWLRSYRGMLAREQFDRGNLPPAPETNSVRTALYGLPFPGVTDEQLISRYERHNHDVREYFRGRSNLLIVDWSRGDGWRELCDFLGMSAPATQFPHANRAPST